MITDVIGDMFRELPTRNRRSGGHNEFGDLNREFFRYAQWLTGSAWVAHDSLFPVGHDNQLRAHYAYSESDWKHVPEHCCQH